MQPWWHTCVELIQAGRRAEAIELTKRIAERGDLAAKVRLAMFGAEVGISHEQADLVVEEASLAAANEDETLHWVLRGAYDLGLGTCACEEKSRRVLKHLEMFAQASGSSMAVIAVARIYASGSLGIPANTEAAVEWYHFASALGESDAEFELRQLSVA